MKLSQLFIVIILMLYCINLIAEGPHTVSIPVFTETAEKPTSLSFNATLYMWSEGNWVQRGNSVTESSFNCSYNSSGTIGRIIIQLGTMAYGWQVGDKLTVTGTYSPGTDQTGTSTFLVGTVSGLDVEQLPTDQGMQLLAVQDIDNWSGDTGSAALDNGDFSITRTTSGSTDTDVSVAAPSTHFASLPEGARTLYIGQCFSVEFEDEVDEVDVDFTWSSSDIVANMSASDLLVSPDGISWIYSGDAAGITLDASTPWSYSSDEMTVSFTTTQKYALYAVSDGDDSNNPDVTVPNIPTGKTAAVSGSTPTLTISCNPVTIPGAKYQLYESTDNDTWTSTIGSFFTASEGSDPSQGVDHSTDALDFYGLKVYNGTTEYMCDLGDWRYVFKNNYSFSTDASKYKTNLVPIPFTDNKNGFTTARGLMDEFSDCDAVVKFNSTDQSYTYYNKYNPGTGVQYLGENFAIQPDGVYFISIGNTVSSPTFHGTLNNTDFTLYEGLNIIYMPVPTTLTDSASLETAIEALDTGKITCTKVQQWNASGQSWNTYDGSTGNFTLSGGLQPVFVTIEIDETGSTSYSYGK